MNKLVNFSLLMLLSAPAYPAEPPILERWECAVMDEYGIASFDQIDVVARIHEGRTSGEISVAGVNYDTYFNVYGFDRRWDFGRFTFTIATDRIGRYFDHDVTDENGQTPARQRFRCRQRSASEAAGEVLDDALRGIIPPR